MKKISSLPGRMLLIGWDAADWQVINPLLEAGQMPNLNRMIEEGVMANLATLQPPISPMLWTSIATGKTADKHGVHGFVERDPLTGAARPVASTSRRTKAIWNIFQQALGWRCHTVAWWAGHPVEPLDGASVSKLFFESKQIGPNLWQVPEHSIHPPELGSRLAPLRMEVNEVDETLVLPFIPRAAEIDQQKDWRLESFAVLMSECCSVQAAATTLMEEQPWDFAAVYFDAIDHFSHTFMSYHPPRLPHVPERDFGIYGDVVNSVYRFHDLMLGHLLELAGPEATVVLCSDHGFQSGPSRPYDNPREPAGPTLWHRDFGVLVMKGPGLKRDERIYGVNLLDIAPTLLTLAGLPLGKDMDGKPLLEALVDPTPPATIPSWDAVPGRAGQHPPDFKWTASDAENDALMAQFAALGYIDDPTKDRQQGGQDADVECRYNLSQVHLSAGHPDQAIAILEPLVGERPWESRFIHQLANAYLKGDWFRAAEELLARAYPRGEAENAPPVVVQLMRVKARLRLGDRAGAESGLEALLPRMLRHLAIWIEAGWLWLEIPRLDLAEKCFRRAIELDDDAPSAWQGLSAVHLRRRENLEAIDAALEAVRRLHHLPVAHLNLGIALARIGQTPEALVALRRAAGMAPGNVLVHRWLAALYATREPDGFLAGVHRNEARRLSSERAQAGRGDRARAGAARPIPDLPSPAERELRGHAERPLPQSPGTSGRTFVIVSGLPRSGTSLMMQMLAAGGLPPRTDGERSADPDNPEGYLEWEAIKRLAREPQLLDDPALEGHTIKAVSALLPSLPRQHRYRVVFMTRPASEIVRSQAKMIARLGTAEAGQSEEDLATILQNHRDKALADLRGNPAVFDVLEVDYPGLVADPAGWAARVAEFVGAERLPHPERMASAVRADLHRNRAVSGARSADPGVTGTIA